MGWFMSTKPAKSCSKPSSSTLSTPWAYSVTARPSLLKPERIESQYLTSKPINFLTSRTTSWTRSQTNPKSSPFQRPSTYALKKRESTTKIVTNWPTSSTLSSWTRRKQPEPWQYTRRSRQSGRMSTALVRPITIQWWSGTSPNTMTTLNSKPMISRRGRASCECISSTRPFQLRPTSAKYKQSSAMLGKPTKTPSSLFATPTRPKAKRLEALLSIITTLLISPTMELSGKPSLPSALTRTASSTSLT